MEKNDKHLYAKNKPVWVAVDCIIFGFDNEKLKQLLIKRNFEPEKGKWSLMGGFLEQNETLEGAAQRILFELTGLKDIYLEQLFTYSEPNRDSAGRVISVAYYALININEYDLNLSKNHNAHWHEVDKIPDLIFDHNQMVEKARKRLQRKAATQPIGFELLPKNFTLPQLQLLYEAIYGKDLDKRNFRKNILSSGLLIKQDEKNKEYSKKGAFLYQFDQNKYNELVEKGITITFN